MIVEDEVSGCEQAAKELPAFVSHEFVEIERDRFQPADVIREARHVALLTPTALGLPDFRIAAVVVDERIQAAARYDDFDAFVENGGEDSVVSTERMADGAESVRLHERQRGEVVDAEVAPGA